MKPIVDIEPKESDSVFAKALKEGLIAGALALGLFCLIVGFRTDQNIRNELILTQRWGLLAIFVLVAAVARFLITYTAPWREARKKSKRIVEAKEPSAFRKSFPKIGLGLLFIYPFLVILILAAYNGSIMGGLQGSLKYVDNFGIQILIYVMLAWGLNIVVGLAGLLDLGYVAFYAVGAYSYALLSSSFRIFVLAAFAHGGHFRGHLGRHSRISGASSAW